jgi:hypothetical protein
VFGVEFLRIHQLDVTSVSFSATINKAETTSRRLSVFMQLVPGLTRVILSPSIQKMDQNSESNNCTEVFIVDNQTAAATELLKEILSMLSLSIQSLYGSKKGGLLTAKPATNETLQRNRAKMLFVEAAKEYAPIMLQVVSMLEKPVDACKKANASANSNASQTTVHDDSHEHPRSDTVERKRTDSSDKDWVDVSRDTADVPPATSSPLASPSKTSGPIPKTVILPKLPPPGRKCFNDLVSSQDIALYAVSRLVAQAMKYGGGEASTAVWRVIISSLSNDDGLSDSKENGASSDDCITGIKPGTSWSKQTLCHLVSLVSFGVPHCHATALHRTNT